MPPAPLPHTEMLRLQTLHDYGILGSEPERGFDDLAKLASYICGVPVSLITFVDSERQFFKATVGTDLTGTDRDVSFCTHVVASAQTMVVNDTLKDNRFEQNPLVRGDLGIRFYAGAPLVAPNGEVLGSVCVIDQQPRELSADQVEALEALARQVMALLELRQRLAQNERAALALRQAEKLAAVGSMASSVAHEINNPLQSVTNLLYMVEATENRGERNGYLRMAQDELLRVTQIVTQTLRFHNQSSNAVPSRLGSLLESVLLLYRTRLRHAGAHVSLRDRQVTPVMCFVDDVRQVFAALIANSLDTLAHGGGGDLHMRVHDGTHPTSGARGAYVVVSDTGSGIAPETKQHLFEPFNTTKGIRGTGLGLWVSKGILDRHGASIRVRSCTSGSHRGTTIRMFFPQQPEDTGASAAVREFEALQTVN